MMDDMSPEQQESVVQQHVHQLMEHFECVQILVSTMTPEGTVNVFLGAGNWSARQGMAHDFIRQADARTDAAQIKLAIKPDDE